MMRSRKKTLIIVGVSFSVVPFTLFSEGDFHTAMVAIQWTIIIWQAFDLWLSRKEYNEFIANLNDKMLADLDKKRAVWTEMRDNNCEGAKEWLAQLDNVETNSEFVKSARLEQAKRRAKKAPPKRGK